ncbi:HAD-IIB family hydrolase [Pontiella sp.]|uniref:HAD-IIB family hydrolase n=1 Tax=Pontiella sp. TaxID=2837462 RepID=UPI003564650B
MNAIDYLLASDMDGTVIPLDDRPQREKEIASFAEAFGQQKGLALAYATGRDLQRVLKGIAQWKLPTPDWLICDVGTSLYRPGENGGEWILSDEYRAEMLKRFGGHTAEDVARTLKGYPEQDASRQTEFKHSYVFDTADHPEQLLPEIDGKLKAAGIHAELVYSVDVYTGEAFLDVLPAGVAKDYAVHFLLNLLRLDAEHVVYAGDSGNDEHAFKSGLQGIVVSNADPKLIADLKAWADDDAKRGRLFFASQPFIAGVHEGCLHFGLLS